jgi:hypothetical protein
MMPRSSGSGSGRGCSSSSRSSRASGGDGPEAVGPWVWHGCNSAIGCVSVRSACCRKRSTACALS